LVDTSIWIELLAAKPRRGIGEEDLLRFATCGPIVQEVLQGLRPGPQSDAFRTAFLAIPVLSDPIPLSLFVSAAEIYREGGRRAGGWQAAGYRHLVDGGLPDRRNRNRSWGAGLAPGP
jgi:predicted nucleic acid-binding protein